jgi:hypothetical protein
LNTKSFLEETDTQMKAAATYQQQHRLERSTTRLGKRTRNRLWRKMSVPLLLQKKTKPAQKHSHKQQGKEKRKRPYVTRTLREEASIRSEQGD